jgi:hypothetical protein
MKQSYKNGSNFGVARAGLEKIVADLRFYRVGKSSFSGKISMLVRHNWTNHFMRKLMLK